MVNDPTPVERRSKRWAYGDGHGLRFKAARLLDSDESSAISWNPTGLENATLWKLHFLFRDLSGSDNDVDLQINGVTTGNYSYQTRTGGTINSEQTSQTEIQICSLSSTLSVGGTLTITAGMLGEGGTVRSQYPTVGGDGAIVADPGDEILISGRLENAQNNLNSLKITTVGKARGRALIEGIKI